MKKLLGEVMRKIIVGDHKYFFSQLIEYEK